MHGSNMWRIAKGASRWSYTAPHKPYNPSSGELDGATIVTAIIIFVGIILLFRYGC